MSIEAIKQVNQAERDAADRKSAASAQAKQCLRDAELAGRALLEQSRKDAEAEVQAALAQAEANAAKHSEQVLADNAGVCTQLSAAAEGRLEAAAKLIVQRIVSSYWLL